MFYRGDFVKGVRQGCKIEQEERKGEAGRCVLLTEMEEMADKEEVLDRGEDIRRYWGGGGQRLTYGREENEMEDSGIGQERESERKKGSSDK